MSRGNVKTMQTYFIKGSTVFLLKFILITLSDKLSIIIKQVLAVDIYNPTWPSCKTI